MTNAAIELDYLDFYDSMSDTSKIWQKYAQ